MPREVFERTHDEPSRAAHRSRFVFNQLAGFRVREI
jgi:hypothetical protein